MICKIVFLDVGNADSIIICPEKNPCILVDIPNPRKVSDWLNANGKERIDNIYITHDHKDHFIGLNHFIAFINQWSATKESVNKIVVGSGIYEALFNKIHELEMLKKKDTPEYKRLQNTLAEINLLRKKGIYFPLGGRDDYSSYSKNDLSIRILHPDAVFTAQASAKKFSNLNEISLVLRISYGQTTALLLADLEAKGIADFLSVASNEELEAQIVKIPHHGAWKEPSHELEKLLNKINPQIALLSVGSKNSYGHVKPKLFQKLIEMTNNKAQNLCGFFCTEATRTCIQSLADRNARKNRGLNMATPCAGDITLICDLMGGVKIKTQNDIKKAIEGFKYPACKGKAELT